MTKEKKTEDIKNYILNWLDPETPSFIKARILILMFGEGVYMNTIEGNNLKFEKDEEEGVILMCETGNIYFMNPINGSSISFISLIKRWKI